MEITNPERSKFIESAWGVILPIIGCALLFLFAAVKACEPTTANAKEFSDEEIVNAIYKAEGGKKARYPYGIRSIKCKTERTCREICFRTVKNNKKRFSNRPERGQDFIAFLANRYAPILEKNDPKCLNKNWTRLVKLFLKKE